VTRLAQLLVAGVAVGSLYGLIALGFVVVYRASHVFNFAHGSFLLLGAYLTYGFHQQLGLPFFPALGLAAVAAAAAGVAVERLALRRMVGQPPFAVIMITIGVALVMDALMVWAWGAERLTVGDPWGLTTYRLGGAGGVRVAAIDIARLLAAGLVLAAYWLFCRYSSLGVAMRATAADQEAAVASGIDVHRVFAVCWALAAAIATVAGVLLAGGARGVDPSLSAVALAAFPALVLGGVNSPVGAIVGGLALGVVEVLAAGYGPGWLPGALGANVHTVVPYLVLLGVLLVRPSGMFGDRERARL
jgi:branched-chain amino acid transport system permease protein